MQQGTQSQDMTQNFSQGKFTARVVSFIPSSDSLTDKSISELTNNQTIFPNIVFSSNKTIWYGLMYS